MKYHFDHKSEKLIYPLFGLVGSNVFGAIGSNLANGCFYFQYGSL